ncbi:hypothetical protein B0H14DRAFT_2866769, partial [Mycena olivaceomarginata]
SLGSPARPSALVFTRLMSLRRCPALPVRRPLRCSSIHVQEHVHSSFPAHARLLQANSANTTTMSSTSSARSSC